MKCLLKGFFQNVAIRFENSKYRPVSSVLENDDEWLELHPTSVLNNICPLYVVYDEIIFVHGHRYMMQVSAIPDSKWLFET